MSDSGEGQAQLRRSTQAASVSRPWWEPGAVAPAPPPFPVVPAPEPPAHPSVLPTPQVQAAPSAPAQSSALAVRSIRELELERELEAARAEVQALHEMLEDLPEIFERKFRQRVHGLVDEQQRLLADNQLLRDRLYALTPATPTARLGRTDSTGRGSGSLAALSGSLAPEPERKGLRRTLLDALGGRRSPASAQRQAPSPLSDRDDGRTTAA